MFVSVDSSSIPAGPNNRAFDSGKKHPRKISMIPVWLQTDTLPRGWPLVPSCIWERRLLSGSPTQGLAIKACLDNGRPSLFLSIFHQKLGRKQNCLISYRHPCMHLHPPQSGNKTHEYYKHNTRWSWCLFIAPNRHIIHRFISLPVFCSYIS